RQGPPGGRAGGRPQVDGGGQGAGRLRRVRLGFRPRAAGLLQERQEVVRVRFLPGRSPPTTPSLRLKDQEIDGIDAEVMYGILGIGLRMQDRELIQTVYEIYNDWAADFCKSNPQRFVGLACIPSHDPAAAAGELRRAARLG